MTQGETETMGAGWTPGRLGPPLMVADRIAALPGTMSGSHLRHVPRDHAT